LQARAVNEPIVWLDGARPMYPTLLPGEQTLAVTLHNHSKNTFASKNKLQNSLKLLFSFNKMRVRV
jgi:hypothetical protein